MTFMSEEADGTLLESVTSGYAAFSAGLRAGDVICKLNGKVTSTVTQLSHHCNTAVTQN
jgi:S1-C subfamily serine protease